MKHLILILLIPLNIFAQSLSEKKELANLDHLKINGFTKLFYVPLEMAIENKAPGLKNVKINFLKAKDHFIIKNMLKPLGLLGAKDDTDEIRYNITFRAEINIEGNVSVETLNCELHLLKALNRLGIKYCENKKMVLMQSYLDIDFSEINVKKIIIQKIKKPIAK